MEDLPDEAFFPVEEEMEAAVGPEENFTPSVDPPVAAAPEPEPAPEPVFAPDTAPKPEAETQEAVPAPLGTPSGDGQFSTETLADLYAQQGLFEKAATIYRQILDQTPDNEVVKLKLDAMQEQSPTDAVSVQEVQPREEGPTESLQKGGNGDTLSVLEGFLENAERMKRP